MLTNKIKLKLCPFCKEDPLQRKFIYNLTAIDAIKP